MEIYFLLKMKQFNKHSIEYLNNKIIKMIDIIQFLKIDININLNTIKFHKLFHYKQNIIDFGPPNLYKSGYYITLKYY